MAAAWQYCKFEILRFQISGDEAIRRHRGEAETARAAFDRLTDGQKAARRRFLLSL
jgi:hypothetical protein